MSTNPHYNLAEHGPDLPDADAANEHYLAAEGVTDGTMQFGVLNRIAEASLALAYEQRTANLIAALEALYPKASGWSEEAEDLREQIAQRLGLEYRA